MKLTMAAVSLVALMGFPLTIHAAEAKRPEWCKPGYQCLANAEIVADGELHLNLREQVLKYRARAKRLGWTVGPGFGVSEVVDENLDVHRVYGVGFFVVWGFRF